MSGGGKLGLARLEWWEAINNFVVAGGHAQEPRAGTVTLRCNNYDVMPPAQPN